MKKIKTAFWAILIIVLFLPISGKAQQQVNIVVPVDNIFNRTEFTTVQNVLYTNQTGWKYFILSIVDPTFNAISFPEFRHKTQSGLSLPTDLLQYRLATIGGQQPPFGLFDHWPEFKSFSASPQVWYEPSWLSSHPRGPINFTFKIPGAQFAGKAFQAGEYAMEITHNYGGGFFTPDSFSVVISIPQAIKWFYPNNTAFTQVSSLEEFRSAPALVSTDLGMFELGNTVAYKLHAKAASNRIQFTSSKGVAGNRDIDILNLSSSNPRINTLPLSSSWKNYTVGNFPIENGNRANFHLQFSASQANFRNNFFQAGTYKLQLNLRAQSADNSLSSPHNIDFTLTVLPLSEITMPMAGNEVNFEFNTIAQYQNGQSKIVANQLRLSNNETYELYVKSDAAYFRRAGVQSGVPSSILQIGVAEGGPVVALAPTSQKIITNGTPVLDKDLDIRYTIPPNAAQSLIATEKSTYTINVIYSFTSI